MYINGNMGINVKKNNDNRDSFRKVKFEIENIKKKYQNSDLLNVDKFKENYKQRNYFVPDFQKKKILFKQNENIQKTHIIPNKLNENKV